MGCELLVKEELQELCGVMNLPPPPSKSDMYNYALGSAAEDVAHKSMREAVEEAVKENENSCDLTVSMALGRNGVIPPTIVLLQLQVLTLER